MSETDLDARRFEARLRELVSSLGASRENEGSIECVGCRACQGCTFCRDSERLCRCHYCVRCSISVDCSHCRGSRALVACNHAVDCESCLRSSFIVRSVSLSDCTYCFGCVGLSGRDFHILNRPFDRTAYFDVTRRLLRELSIGPER